MSAEKEIALALLSSDQLQKNRSAASKTLGNLLTYAGQDSVFAKSMCARVIDQFSRDDELAGLILKRRNPERLDKKPGRRINWINSKLARVYLEYKYQVDRGVPDRDAIEIIAFNCGLSSSNRHYYIKKKIAQGRAIVEKSVVK